MDFENNNNMILDKSVSFEENEIQISFKCIFDNLSIPLVIVDHTGELLYVNFAFVNLIGISTRRNKQPKQLVQIISPAIRHEIIRLFSKLRLNNHHSEYLKTQLEDASGEELNISIALDEIQNSKYFLIRFAEDTAKTQVSSGNEIKNDEFESLFLHLSHNLKSPIVSIQGFTNSLIENYTQLDKNDIIFYLDRIRKNSVRLENMVVDLLKYSKSARKINTFKTVSLNQLVKNVCIEYHVRMKSNNIKIKVQEPLPQVVGDAESLSTVFFNLIDNAIKYFDKNKDTEIEIGWEAQKRFDVFWVKDNGVGVEDDCQEKVFNLFQRAESTNHVEGTGVGLAIVKRIIENHGGQVRMSSKIGKGTTVFFALPRLVDESSKF